LDIIDRLSTTADVEPSGGQRLQDAKRRLSNAHNHSHALRKYVHQFRGLTHEENIKLIKKGRKQVSEIGVPLKGSATQLTISSDKSATKSTKLEIQDIEHLS